MAMLRPWLSSCHDAVEAYLLQQPRLQFLAKSRPWKIRASLYPILSLMYRPVQSERGRVRACVVARLAPSRVRLVVGASGQ